MSLKSHIMKKNALMYWRIIKRSFGKNFDKAFYNSKGMQFVWLGGMVLALAVFGFILAQWFKINEWRVVELILDPGAFVDSFKENGDFASTVVQLIIALLGAVIFTSMLINAFGNWLDRRIENYRRGEVVYEFDHHILILGANSMLINILKSLVATDENKTRDIVVLTNKNIEELRGTIISEIPTKMVKNIYVIYGNRTKREILEKLYAHEAKSIYILGEDNEPAHDSVSIKCYEHLKDICNKSDSAIKCYMVFDRLSTINHYYFKQHSESTEKLHLTIINSLENIAQRVLVSREYCKNKLYPTIDRGGIDKNSENSVHIVVVGMSQIGYAIAMTAAHVCHFPNFNTKGIRTKITFIQENIRQEMDFFVSRYQSLFDLSYRKYIQFDKEEVTAYYPKTEYLSPKSDPKGFLDIEWEFIDGGIETEKVREYLEECVHKDTETEYLTIAFCNNNAEQNLAASLFLPKSVYDKDIPVFVYQPGGGEIINSVNSTTVYNNVYPFGMKSDCYDPQYHKRLIRARRIKYLYDINNVNQPFEQMPTDEELSNAWFSNSQSYAFQQSNLYAANSIAFKLRSIKHNGKDKLSDNETNILAKIEHNRWNMERLIIGFRAYTHDQRMKYISILTGKDDEAKAKTERLLQEDKKTKFIHKDIAPYDELLEKSRNYDKGIVSNIIEILK